MKRKTPERISITTSDEIVDRYGWRRVKAPKSWNPIEAGEELIGYYGGRTLRHGQHGQYEVVIVHVPQRGSFFVSGVRIIQLIDAALIDTGHPIRVHFEGHKELPNGHRMKLFELDVAEGPALAQDMLPRWQDRGGND